MDNHPIPQDVTGFQFKLVGNMTIKQFGYVMLGVVLAVMLYYLPLESAIAVIIKTIFIPIFGVSGFVIAFLPIEGRPIDIMFGNFLKALFMPNQYVYHKTGRLFDFSHLPTSKPATAVAHTTAPSAMDAQKVKQLRQLLQTSHVQKQSKLDEKESAFVQSILSGQTPPPSLQLQQQLIVQQPAPPPVQHNPEQTKPSSDILAKQEDLLTQQLEQAKKDEQAQQAAGEASSSAHQKVTLLERQVQALHFQRQQLEQQLLHLQNQLAHQQQIIQQPPAAAAAKTPQQATPQQTAAQQQNIAQELSKRGLPHIPDTPNVIVGTVKDPRGNVLPNILVEVKDKDGNPVRAFKTNALGQFASATPLAPGNYTVELEDPRQQNKFDVIQLAATNQILLPIEIISHDAREELRKQLFN